ncbi:hypothetical protein ACFYOG_35590 [Streptomyces sp. NPDC007818]|uniref:hypothetical protein n=1 Tax=Streptomyces sp. NPDC007818 TaxID=3364780 RepID=UPI0036896BBE
MRIMITAASTAALLLATAASATAARTPTKTLWAQESVKIRAETTVRSTALGLMPKGASGKSPVDRSGSYKRWFGGKHNACGSKGYIGDDEWHKITYRGVTGFVPAACLMPFDKV